jgi:hypothetical protein
MFHDRIPPDPNDQSANKRKGWLRSLFGVEEDSIATPPRLLDPPIPAAQEDIIGADELVDLAVLATQLAELIQSARNRLDGAVEMVDRSAEDAADYGRMLSASAKAIDAHNLPKNAVQALLDVTRQMIDRTEIAEKRLRATNGELRALQEDLCIAQETAERDPLTGLPNRRARSIPHAAPTPRFPSPSATSTISSA